MASALPCPPKQGRGPPSTHGLLLVTRSRDSPCGGSLDYTRNLLASLARTDEPLSLQCHCADAASLAALRADGALATPLDASLLAGSHGAEGEYHEFKKHGWSWLMWLKLELIRRALETNTFVVYTDGDVVFERPSVLHYLLAAMGEKVELLTQNDALEDRDDGGEVGTRTRGELVATAAACCHCRVPTCRCHLPRLWACGSTACAPGSCACVRRRACASCCTWRSTR